MEIFPGEKLGPYEIVATLGEGGMGRVWKARDTRLNRTIAIKTSHARFSERFHREAHATAALNHPHICALYDVGPDYLVMEYVEGKPVTGPLPLPEVLEYAAQICDALDTAHRQGIVHRDLKPTNILVGKNGIKILDFGLAKFEQAKAQAAEVTETRPLTAEGTVLGTLQYMSPEQIEGQEADARSDIFAFGLVLYEMISGKRPFTGASKTSLIASILKDQPRPLRTLEPLTPAPLERIVATCLEKDPEKRWQSAREVKHALEWSMEDGPSSLPAAAPAAGRAVKPPWMWPTLAAVLLVLLAAASWMLWHKPAAPVRTTRFEVSLPRNVEFSQYVSVSPDGHKLVFNATGSESGLWIHDLDTLEWRKLVGTEGAVSPFWSPDSRFLGFAVGNDLKKIDVGGGPAQTLCTVAQSVGTGAWGRNGMIVFGHRGSGPIHRVSEAGGVATDLTAVDTARGETLHALPSFLPDGKHFLYLRQGTAEVAGIYAGVLDAKPSEQSRKRILATRFGAAYLDGELLFMRDGTLMVQRFDEGKLELRGEPVPVAEHVGTVGSIGIFSVSPAGVLAYRTGPTTIASSQPTWFTREGKMTNTPAAPVPGTGLSLSPDGTRAVGRDALGLAAGDIWLLDLTRAGVRTRLTFGQSQGSPPVWSPDGSRIIFSAGVTPDTIYEKSANGAGEEKVLLKKPGEIKIPTSWSRDGRFLLYFTFLAPNGGVDLWVLPLDGQQAGKPALLLGTKFTEAQGSFSPDGRWIAYVSDETGRFEIYVRPFETTGPSLGEGKWQLSTSGAAPQSQVPKWRSDGKEVIFGAANGAIMAVDVNGNRSAFAPGVPHELFHPPANGGWDVTADGKRFLVEVQPGQQNTQTPITVVLDWAADLKK
jgi:Tol biopolymer transport system component/predicted Ser/Thr protein kinase